MLPKFPVIPLGQLSTAGQLANTRAVGTGASPQLPAPPTASLHTLFSLGGISQVCFINRPLHHSPSGGKKKKNKNQTSKTF